MAFNPFHAFRKRQKTLLAVLTVGVMFLFVFSYGMKGDPFTDMMGGRRGRDETVLKQPDGQDFLFNGKKVTNTDIFKLAHQRQLADSYLDQVYGTALLRISEDIDRLKKDMTKPGAFDLEVFKKQQDLEQKGQKIRFIKFERFQSLAMRSFPESEALNNMLDFMRWRDIAKQLGFYLSNEDIDKLLKASADDMADIAAARSAFLSSKLNRQDQPTDMTEVYEAVRQELYVEQARKAYRANASIFSMSDSSEALTPKERFEEFQRDLNAHFLALLRVSVDDFVSKVDQQPDEGELRKLFDVYKKKEATPESNKPGFMEPRRISLEWVSVKADSPFYRELAHNYVLAAISGMPANGLGTPDYLSGTVLVGRMLKEYHRQTYEKFSPFGSFSSKESGPANDSPYQLSPLTDPHFALSFCTSLSNPENVAPIAAFMALGNPLPAAVSYQSCAAVRDADKEKEAVKRELAKRLKIGCSLLLSSADPFPLTAPALWAGVTQERQYLPMDVVGKQLIQSVEYQIARGLFLDNLAKFKKELEAKRFKPKEAREWLDKAIKEYGFTTHVEVGKPLGKYEIADDEKMAPFKEAYLRQNSFHDAKAEQFGALFFDELGGKGSAFSPKEWPLGVLTPTGGRFEDVDPILYWKTEEDKLPREPAFEEVRTKVEEAWRKQKARTLAKKYAEEIQAKVKEAGADTQKLKDLAAQRHVAYSELVAARLVEDTNPGAMGKRYKSYEFPKDTLHHTQKQAQAKVLNTLVEMKKIGDTVVFANEPEDQFFVAILYNKSEADIDRFCKAYRDAARTGDQKNHFFEIADRQNAEKDRMELMKQLRSKVANVDEDGNYNIEADQKAELGKSLKRVGAP
jgi:hypothetical protein